jgi:hypothetical protein
MASAFEDFVMASVNIPFEDAVWGVIELIVVNPRFEFKELFAENVIVSPTTNPFVDATLILGTRVYALERVVNGETHETAGMGMLAVNVKLVVSGPVDVCASTDLLICTFAPAVGKFVYEARETGV